ncbi:MAG TPA: GAF domain-containing protein [Firmicutes bacterium]|nr:GAF domain-containing protein [Bacillota bacterium]
MSDYAEALKETERTNALLELLLQAPTPRAYLEGVLALLKEWTGCRAVGIRVLREDGQAAPYEVHTGFTRDFWEAENLLFPEKDVGLCLRVLSGKPEPTDLPGVTPFGSFWCPNLPEFLQRLSPAERRRYRGKCAEAGFRTLVIVPVRHQEQTVGLIHLADEEEGKVPLQMVGFLESLSPLIGEAYAGLVWKK